jgi:hypothetical protein
VDHYFVEKSARALRSLARILEAVRKSKSLEKSSKEDIENEISKALWEVTKVAAVAAGVSWSPEEGRLILYEGWDGLETLLVKYGELTETTKQRRERELAEHKARLSDLAADILQLSRQDRGEGRTLIYTRIQESRLDDPIIDQIEDLLEPITMGEKSWLDFREELAALLEPIITKQS